MKKCRDFITLTVPQLLIMNQESIVKLEFTFRGVYSIEAWMQPASLKKRGGTKIMHIFVKIGGGKKN